MEPTDRTEEPVANPTIQELLKTYSTIVAEVQDETGGAEIKDYPLLNEVAEKLKKQESYKEEAKVRGVLNDYLTEQIHIITSRVHIDHSKVPAPL